MGWREKEEAKLANKKILVVGAGGIGCELLKNLVLAGFKNMHVIDMDTIDVSNLNRQFLFRNRDVKKSKSEVASAAVANLVPNVNITFDCESIFAEKFDLNFFKTFDLVLNALDNRAARNHVNRMCLSGRIPLVESGSAGYLGQVSVIMRDRTECYECVPKPVQQKTFPGCTIRNTPSEHIHCTVWSKHLFNQLFGALDIDDDVSPDVNDEENKPKEGEEVMEQEETEKAEREDKEQPNTRLWAEKCHYNPKMVFNKMFKDDIEYLLKMANLWKERRAPVPMDFDSLDDAVVGGSKAQDATSDVNAVWSPAECARVFCECVDALRVRKEALPEGEILHWDKDDEDAMRFVAACANIRATIFGIPAKSLFDIKSMAGNIIAAIPSTNAVVAGMVIVEAMKILDGRLDDLRNVFINRQPNVRGQLLMAEKPQKPNEKCFVCSDKREVFVKLNPETMTVKTLQDKVLKQGLSMQAPDVMDSTTSRIIISSEEGETDDLLEKTLLSLGIKDGALLECDDFKQKMEFRVGIVGSSAVKAEEYEIMQDSGEREDKEEEKEADGKEADRDGKRKSTNPPENDAKKVRVEE